jgi:hypothetical protein
MHKQMISVGLGILAAIIPVFLPNLSEFFAYSLFGVAALLVILGADGLLRAGGAKYVKPDSITIFNVTLGTRDRRRIK